MATVWPSRVFSILSWWIYFHGFEEPGGHIQLRETLMQRPLAIIPKRIFI